jgi:hypothetical protein
MKIKTMILLFLIGFMFIVNTCAIGSYTLEVVIEPEGSGDVIMNPQPPFYPGDSVTLKASPAEGYKFISWSGDITESANPVNITMESNMTVYANYTQIPNMELSVEGTSLPSGTSSYDFGKVEVGYDKTVTFTVSNTGGNILNIHNISVDNEAPLSGQFIVDLEEEYPITVEPEQTTTFMLTYSPSSSGIKTGLLNVYSNDLNQNPYLVDLIGTSPTWTILGNEDFTLAEAENIKLDVTSGVPFVAFRDYARGGRVSVMTYDGQNWTTVGTGGFSSGKVNSISLTTYNSFPYTAYSLDQNSDVNVMTYNGSDWTNVGDTSSFSGEYASLSINEGDVYLAYADGSSSYQPILKMYSGGTWTDVGGGYLATDGAEYVSLFLYDNGTEIVPYVAFKNKQTLQPMVYKFAESAWSEIAGLDLNLADIRDLKVFVENDIPYLSILTGYSNQPLLLMFDGSDWIYIGSEGQSTEPESEFLDIEAYINDSNFPEPFVAFTDPLNDYYGKTASYKQGSYGSYQEEDLGANFTNFNPGKPSVSVIYNPTEDAPQTFVAYSDSDASIAGSITVKSFIGYDGSWSMVGNRGFNSANATDINIKTVYDQETGKVIPYVVNKDEGNSRAYMWNAVYNEVDEVYEWSMVGVNPVSSVETDYVAMDVYNHFDGSTTTMHPYIAYNNGAGGSPIIMYHDGTDWQSTDPPITNTAGEIDIKVYDDGGLAIPYIAFSDNDSSGQLNVMRYVDPGGGYAWETVGTTPITTEAVQDVNLALYDNSGTPTPYVGYNRVQGSDLVPEMKMYIGTIWLTLDLQDDLFPINSNDLSIDVKYDLTTGEIAPFMALKNTLKSRPFVFRYYNGSGWEDISSGGGIGGNLLTNEMSAYIDGTMPYITYRDDNNSILSIKRFDGDEWVDVGDSAFAGSIAEASIYIYEDEGGVSMPYLAYTDEDSRKISVIMYE